MLKLIKLEKIGFTNSIKLNDLFDHEEDSWIVRAISGNRIKGRYINTGGIKGFQHDLIEATVVAQKIGTFDKNNRVSSVTEIKYSFIDVVTKLKGFSVTELTPLEIQKLKNQRRLNELGWSVS